jgi:hypothetical protein
MATTAGAATDDELAFANFGASAELLLKDFYARTLEAKVFGGDASDALKRGRAAAAEHAEALADLLLGAGDTPPAEEDFEFAWPARTFKSVRSARTNGLGVLRALRGSYQTASASVVEPSYRVLYASLAVSIGQQIGTLTSLSGAAGTEPFPVAMDLEAASSALERYLG